MLRLRPISQLKIGKKNTLLRSTAAKIFLRPKKFASFIREAPMPNPRVPPRPMRMYLREWRKFKNMTQDELAERVGTNKGQISKLETGYRDWDKGWIQKFSAAFELDEELHLFRPPESVTVDGLLAGLPSNLEAAILTIVNELKGGRR